MALFDRLIRGFGRMAAGVLTLGLTACGPSSDPGSAGGPARYPAPSPTTSTAAVAPARPVLDPQPPTNALLSVIQTELSPATLWHARSERVSLFADLASTGLGGPTFLAYSSPTGIAVIRPGTTFGGDQCVENWLFVGFPGATGWTRWDSPWAVFLQRRPTGVEFGTNGVSLAFRGPAGYLALMPMYGSYKPPQKDREFLEPQGLKEKGLSTWEWPIVVARDPLVRLRFWSRATRAFPIACFDDVRVDRRRNVVTLRHRFEWLEFADEWGTRPMKVAPVSPTLGLALGKGQTFPAEFSRRPMDFELATPYGPYFGVPEAEGYDVSLPVLRYVNETEAPVWPLPDGSPAVVTQALERLRATARAKFPSPDRYRHDHGGMENFCWAIMGDQWYAKALPYYDEATRSNAVASLRTYVRDEVLVPERFKEREFPAGSGRKYRILEGPGIGSWGVLGDAGKFSANLLQTIWAYAHYTGDHEVVRERWELIRSLFTTAAETRWVGFGRDQIAELGDEAAPAIAYARLAWIAGDLGAYEYACGIVARELVHHYVKQRGARWFREQQPWHADEPMDEEVYLTNLWGDLAGWQIDGPAFPARTGERQFRNRWVRFQDFDVARFYRDHLRTEVGRELVSLDRHWDPKRRFTDDSHIMPSLVRLTSMLTNASPDRLAAIATPDQLQGPASGIIAGCVAILRSARPPRWERLIPGGDPGGFALGLPREVPGPNPYLVQKVSTGREDSPEWPRIEWWGWKTPTGAAWNFGRVQAGDPGEGRPGRVRTTPLNWNTVRIDVEAAEIGSP